MPNSSLSLVLFDFDGTLCDSATTIVWQMRRACTDIGVVAPAPELVRANIGLGLERVAYLYAGDDPGKSAKLAARHRALSAEEYMSSNAPLDPLFEGAKDALSALSDLGYLTGIITNKGRAGLTSLLERHELTSLLDVTVTPNETTPKPAPDMAIQAMRQVGVKTHECVFGDTLTDAECARNAGIQFIAVSWGYNAPKILQAEGAVAILSNFSDLPESVSTVLSA